MVKEIEGIIMDTSLLDLVMSRYLIHIFLIIVCIIWAFYGSEYVPYVPRHIGLKWDNKDLIIRFERSDFVSRSIEEELWYRGIGRTLDQLDSIRKSVSPLWRDLDLILDEWEQSLNDSD